MIIKIELDCPKTYLCHIHILTYCYQSVILMRKGSPKTITISTEHCILQYYDTVPSLKN